jgi:hypothetical protein
MSGAHGRLRKSATRYPLELAGEVEVVEGENDDKPVEADVKLKVKLDSCTQLDHLFQ